ncbi:MAG: DnaB-like helicase C-terminal domain-containing protein [Lachnospiraceae bacterium]|nr:DnaB-like helicase C-terminal domain-containing protein [Lachnospiraceae bacterium]
MAVSKINREKIMDALNEHASNKEILKDDSKVVRTGLKDLDCMLGGLRRGQTYLLGARPSMGKTDFAFNVIKHVAINEGKRVLFFSLDSSKRRLISRFAGFISKIGEGFANDKSEKATNMMENAINEIDNAEIYLDDIPNISIEEITAACSAFESTGKQPDLIIVAERVRTCAELSEIAKRLNCAVLILSQISRNVEEREDHHPVLEDLIESGLKRAVDNIIFLYRDEYYNKDSMREGLADLCIAKSLNGDRGTIVLGYMREYHRFCTLTCVGELENVIEEE